MHLTALISHTLVFTLSDAQTLAALRLRERAGDPKRLRQLKTLAQRLQGTIKDRFAARDVAAFADQVGCATQGLGSA